MVAAAVVMVSVKVAVMVFLHTLHPTLPPKPCNLVVVVVVVVVSVS